MFRLLAGLFSLIAVAHSWCEDQSKGPQVYDPDTSRCYPISETSLQYDSVFLPSEVDHKEFPPEYLNSLLSHCNDSMPTYKDFLTKAWISFKEFGLNWSRYPFNMQMFHRYLMAIDPVQIVHTLSIAFLMTITRLFVEKHGLIALVKKAELPERSARKIIESGWKTLWCSVMWLISLKIIFFSNRKDFYYPLCIVQNSVFQVGYFDIPLPTDYYLAYILQTGFYVYSLWAVFFIDTWRKDSKLTAVHHVLTCLLLQGSIINRYHRLGLLVLFFHDFNDIFLEIAKITSCLRVRNGKPQKIFVILGNVLFAIFTVTWVLFRLYWFPLKALHATTWGAYIIAVGREARGYLFFNFLLWSLFLMHVYWFTLIIRMALRLLFSPSNKVNDVREYDSDEEQNVTSKQNGHGPVPNGYGRSNPSK